jgi:hypothetical protein
VTDEKHITYFRVLEAAQSAPGCPLCWLETKAVHSYLRSLLYENVNDVGVRHALKQSGGFCAAHAAKLLALADGLGIALLYQSVIAKALEDLVGASRHWRMKWRRQHLQWENHSGCPACAVREDARTRFARTLVNGLEQPEMRKAVRAGRGLCVPHLSLILSLLESTETRRELQDMHRVHYEALYRELELFCEKHDYRKTKDGFGAEFDSWKRAIYTATGWDWDMSAI